MPAWKAVLSEDDQWHVINYVRALSSGSVTPGRMMGGDTFDPAVDRAQRLEMLATAVEQNVITQTEADTFDSVHAAMDTIMRSDMLARMGDATEIQKVLLDSLIASGTITETQADVFNDVHDKLMDAGLMQ